MTQVSKRTISFTPAHNELIEEKLKSGAYSSASEVVRNGLRALQERDEAIEDWLKREVVPIYDRIAANPSELLDADAVFDEILSST
jgi:antitoxin ParD1/3/4